MKKLKVSDKELLMLLDAVNLLQSASVYTHNKEDLCEKLGLLATKLVNSYTEN